MNTDVYTRVTQKIIADLEQGVRPWLRPWNAEHAAGKISRPLRHNGQPYAGVNVLMLWMEATEKGYSAPIWMTFRQAQELGAHVRKGEHGSLVVYANTITQTETNAKTGEDEEKAIPFMKGYTVFNVEQIEGLPAHYYAQATPPTLSPDERNARMEAFFTATHADIRHTGHRAFYAIGPDHIQMPPFEFFKDPESYYATLAHECTHWTRHPSRLDRDLGRKKWGDAGYAMEELVAEIGSAFVCAELGLTPEVREDHAAYIETWLTVLKGDRQALFTAASHAQKAADFLQSLQPAPTPEPETHPERAPEISTAPGAVAESTAATPPAPDGMALSAPPPRPAARNSPRQREKLADDSSSVLAFPDRGPWGNARYRGNCSGHVYRRLFEMLQPQVFTDPTVGGGTSVEVAREMGIEAYGLDLHSGFNILKQRILDAVGKPSDLVFSHPPYHNLIAYSGAVWGTEPHPDDLSRCATEEEFMDKLIVAMKNQRHATQPGGYYGTLIGDIRKDGQYFSLQAELITRCPKRELRAILIKQQFNPASDRKAYPLPLPRIRHEYVILWQKVHAVSVPVSAPTRAAPPTEPTPPAPPLRSSPQGGLFPTP